MRNFLASLCLLSCFTIAHAQDAGTAGAFARMGFGARGMGMGNTLTAVTTGDISTYYNPALSAFAEHRTASATFGVLSLDRSLNFLSYTQSVQPTGGISLGLINAGVSNIDGSDGDGVHTENYSTFENQIFLAFSNRVGDDISLGASIKVYYSKLFDEVKSTTVGFDIGGAVRITDQLSGGAVLQDINSKYKWDTKAIYGPSQAKTTEDKFPTLRRIGLAFSLPTHTGVLTAECENSSQGTTILRFGAEYARGEAFTVRGGLDRLDFSDDATGAKPTFGFSVKNSFNGWMPELNYAFVFESFAPHGMHIITLSAVF